MNIELTRLREEEEEAEFVSPLLAHLIKGTIPRDSVDRVHEFSERNGALFDLRNPVLQKKFNFFATADLVFVQE